MAVSHFSPQFQISAEAETSHVIVTKCQPGGRAETRHVTGPLERDFAICVSSSQKGDKLWSLIDSTKIAKYDP